MPAYITIGTTKYSINHYTLVAGRWLIRHSDGKCMLDLEDTNV